MLIKNSKELATNSSKNTALEILEAGLDAANPKKSIEKFVKPNKIINGKKSFHLSKSKNVYVVSFGKAADSMAKALDSILKIKGGVIVIPKGSKNLIQSKKFQIFHAGHPLPNNSSVRAAKFILKFLEQRKKNDTVIFLVSGGGSSLVSLPAGISLKEKIQTSNLLLKSGATIQEFNCVRKHLSKIKGGMMVENLKCQAIALVMSDVENNDLSSISSGCTYYDTTTFQNSLKIIKKYNLGKKIPKHVLKRLKDGSAGKIKETPKKPRIKNQIIATNNDCLKSMEQKAKQLGYKPKIITVSGNVTSESKKIIQLLPKKKNSCLIFGGETTVNVTGKGKGGRNQELVLRILRNSKKTKNDLVISSIGTDGIDGNTKDAGAIIEKSSISNNIIDLYLKNNDSNSFFRKYGGLIKTGYTHTNLLDIGVILS
ncbi:MAG: glycerate kinase [Nitrosopumilaceae archaeon]